MNQPALKFDTRQTQSATPRLQYAVRLLQLSALDYEQELHALIARNPFLEIGDAAGGAANTGTGCESHDERFEPSEPADVHEPERSTEPERDAEPGSWTQTAGLLRDGAKDAGTRATDLMAADTGLRQHLHGQAHLLPLSARDHALVFAVIESLDDDGYLRSDLAEIGEVSDLDPPVECCELSIALRLVQSFDPSGVGARTVAECLSLQAEKLDPALRRTACRIVAGEIDRLAARDVAGIARRLALPIEEVDLACAALRRLDPRPGWRFSRPDTHYISPDVIARKVHSRWVVQLNGALMPQLRLNRTCADLFLRHREPRHSELGAHLQEARWALRNVEQRFATILAVAQAILRRQYLFFEYGPLAMKPLALRDVAQEVGIHESTVCRVTNNKYIATPNGLFELKRFFSRAMPMAGGGACSATAIRGVVKEMIDAEDPRAPLSDVAIAHRLAREGLTVARRTVTKYRQGLKIAPADRRRQSSVMC